MTKPSSLPLADAADEGERPASALTVPVRDSGVLGMIERLAGRPGVDVATIRELVLLQERILDRDAKAAFESAYAEMQPELPEIDEKGRIKNKDGTTRSTYAKLEDINIVIKPILKQFGFSIRHKTEWPADKPKIIRVVGILSHRDGHRETSEFEAPADESDFRTDIQSEGSTVSYGRRYTTLDLLNITTRGVDNDGQRGTPKAPDGFDAWFAVLGGIVSEGPNKLQEAFAKSSTEFKNYTVQHKAADWADMKQKAQKAVRR